MSEATYGKSRVVFSGENPGLTLYKPGTEQIVAAASYWRCVYSAHGEGNALLIWVDPAGSGLGDLAPHAIYTDNTGVARLVAERFTQYFGTFRDHGFAVMPTSHARFFQESDSRWYHRVACNTGEQVVELVWWDVLDYQMRKREDYALGPSRWDLATVICPCASASISVSNRRVAGEVRSSREGEQPTSSAFLAFSETWVERG
jgi:hypothetical protein